MAFQAIMRVYHAVFLLLNQYFLVEHFSDLYKGFVATLSFSTHGF